MSATIGINNSKFVIFGAGHDYTLADSGEGEKVFFSHPFVPLNSVNYAGQYYFQVPDENGDMFDAVKDDIAHCTFTPDLNTAFDTEGEVEITVKYRREYIYPEETLLVEKELTQTIEVVDHGAPSSTSDNLDIYPDGYGFIHPKTTGAVEVKYYVFGSKSGITKLSSLPWRATGLGHGIYKFIQCSTLTDISELEYADVSNCTEFSSLFDGCSALSDISALESWDVSKVEEMDYLFSYTAVSDLSPLASWNTASLKDLENAFENIDNVKTLKGLENWDVSNVDTLKNTFNSNSALEDISALANWDVSKVTNLDYTFSGGNKIKSLKGLERWDVSAVTTMEYTFNSCETIKNVDELINWRPQPTSMSHTFYECYKLVSLAGLANFDTSECTTLGYAFGDCGKMLSLHGLEDWDVSKVKNFTGAFDAMPWLSDISALADWDVSAGEKFDSMFRGTASILDVSDLSDWDVSNATDIGGMFGGFYKYYSSKIDKNVWANAYYYFDYEGTQYTHAQVEDVGNPLSVFSKDASGVNGWTVNINNPQAFDNKWSNIPAWN